MRAKQDINMLILGQLGLLIVLVRASVNFFHPFLYATLWSLFALLGAMLAAPAFTVIFLIVLINFIIAAVYFYLLEYSDGTWWWWVIMLVGGWLLLVV
jgi:hypothetical protein